MRMGNPFPKSFLLFFRVSPSFGAKYFYSMFAFRATRLTTSVLLAGFLHRRTDEAASQIFRYVPLLSPNHFLSPYPLSCHFFSGDGVPRRRDHMRDVFPNPLICMNFISKQQSPSLSSPFLWHLFSISILTRCEVIKEIIGNTGRTHTKLLYSALLRPGGQGSLQPAPSPRVLLMHGDKARTCSLAFKVSRLRKIICSADACGLAREQYGVRHAGIRIVRSSARAATAVTQPRRSKRAWRANLSRSEGVVHEFFTSRNSPRSFRFTRLFPLAEHLLDYVCARSVPRDTS